MINLLPKRAEELREAALAWKNGTGHHGRSEAVLMADFVLSVLNEIKTEVRVINAAIAVKSAEVPTLEEIQKFYTEAHILANSVLGISEEEKPLQIMDCFDEINAEHARWREKWKHEFEKIRAAGRPTSESYSRIIR